MMDEPVAFWESLTVKKEYVARLYSGVTTVLFHNGMR